jgi:hypothetical protein
MSKQIEVVANAVKKTLNRRKSILSVMANQEKARFGWEKWLQVELAGELEKIGEPLFEVQHTYDLRMLKPKHKVRFDNYFVDIQFWHKDHLRKYVTAIELKLNSTQKGLRPALSDLIKIGATLNDKWRFRSVIAVLVFQESESETKYVRILRELEERYDAICNKKPCGGYDYVVFGWQRSSTKNMTRENYREWLSGIEGVFKGENAAPRKARRRDS